MKVVLDTSVVLGEGQSSFRYFSELIPRLKQESDLSLEILPSPYFELPKEWYPEKPAYQPLIPKAPWLPQGKIRSLLSQVKGSIEGYRRDKKLYIKLDKAIFHSFYYTLPPRKNLRSVSIMHDTIPEVLSNETGHGPHFTNLILTKKRSIEHSDRIIAVSQSTKKDICHFYSVSPEKIDVIYHASPTNFSFQTDAVPIFDEPYLLQVGGRMYHRNFFRLAEAFFLGGFYKDYLLACAGSDWCDEEISLLKRLGIKNRVKLLKNPSNSTLKILYQNAEMLVYPSLYEGFGFPLVEAMACGTPVATSRGAGSIEEVAGEGAVYFNPRDPNDMAKQIAELLNPAVASLYVARGFKNIKRFSWEQTAQETIQCYHKVLTG